MAGLETKVTASINSSWTHNPGVCLLTPVMQAETCLQSAPATQLAFFCMLNTLLLTCNIPFACCEHPWYVCCLRCTHNHVELVRDAICTAMVQGNVQAQQPESSFPAMQPADAVRYQSMFQQMDNDRDGYVQASCLVTGQSASPFSCSNKCGCVCSQLQQEASTLGVLSLLLVCIKRQWDWLRLLAPMTNISTSQHKGNTAAGAAVLSSSVCWLQPKSSLCG